MRSSAPSSARLLLDYMFEGGDDAPVLSDARLQLGTMFGQSISGILRIGETVFYVIAFSFRSKRSTVRIPKARDWRTQGLKSF